MTAALLSVVIPTCNRPQLLSTCLDALRRSLEDLGRSDVVVIVTDDSAGAETQRLIAARYPWVVWVAGPHGGPARNRNFGASHARSIWMVLLDDDCIPHEGWLRAYCRAFDAHPNRNVFEGCTVADREQQRLDEEAPANTRGGYLWACNFAIRRELFARIGGFCEEFPYPGCEDSDLAHRLRKHGERFEFVPEAVVCHPLRPAKGLRYQRAIAQSYLLLVKRHPEILGRSPRLNATLNLMRRVRILWRLATQMRFKGLGFAIGSLSIQTTAEFRAASRLRAVAE